LINRRLKSILNLLNGEEIMVIIDEKRDKKKGRTTDYMKNNILVTWGRLKMEL
jgi:SRSO17 transposase